MLGVGAPAPDSVEYKAKIEQLDSDPFGPDPDLLTDDAEPCALMHRMLLKASPCILTKYMLSSCARAERHEQWPSLDGRPPELLKRAAATAPHFEEGGAPI